VKLSRRDRAAMTLALECVRESRCGLNEASRALGIGDADSRFLREAMGHNWYGHVDRVRRARLALALRVLLRCDRGRDDLGDFGPIAWNAWDSDGPVDERDFTRLPVRPLWEMAPEHRSER